MIVVKVELWPFGDPNQSEEIGRLHIVNDGSGSSPKGNYQVYAGDPESSRFDAKEKAEVKGHIRKKGIWPLLRDAVVALFPSE